MKDRKNKTNSFVQQIRCTLLAKGIERRRRQEKKLRDNLKDLEGDPAWDAIYRMQELHIRTDALEIRYARLARDAQNPEQLAV